MMVTRYMNFKFVNFALNLLFIFAQRQTVSTLDTSLNTDNINIHLGLLISCLICTIGRIWNIWFQLTWSKVETIIYL